MMFEHETTTIESQAIANKLGRMIEDAAREMADDGYPSEDKVERAAARLMRAMIAIARRDLGET